ncbi:LysM peptidoglycan-binding domain-containing protein [Antarcticibacterium flavum]|uniref:Peptidoglycan hydrolase n=1 Tax=Antarcticibacterium flavum TaxID=2058175 RepID=A0A5B7X5U6_9FLAO|nr:MULTISPECIES: glucosaminidase domain-containing protein [Antarcticibacterium]MCM4159564.1 N-acetylmuramidase [Antarcticibacterium sp. W02-3]QCY70816.1 LysM peptidoglycan-binding domain-containing protein [Antarcticibacterium flavum]
MRSKYFFLLLFTVAFLYSCGSKKKAVTKRDAPAEVVDNVRKDMPPKRYADVVEEYIDTYAAIAQEEMRLYKIPASITLAQGILESGAGRGDLTRRANNHFGIKCHEWTGDRVYHDDDRSQECFRKYNDPKFSYRDHSLFLAERRRYAALFDLEISDYKGWAKGLRAAGYATDRLYPNKLIDLIERYQLYNYDNEVLGVQPRRSNNPVARSAGTRHVVQKGDTLYSIAKRYNTTVELIQRQNNLNSTNISIGQELSVPPR